MIKKWLQFLWQRFSPIYYFPLIIIFFISHYVFYFAESSFELSNNELLILVPALLGTTLFFLKLRIYDEIKDYNYDKRYHPERPLPSKLITISDLKYSLILIIITEFLCFVFYGLISGIFIGIVILYSLLMYKEFFVRTRIRRHLTLYAILHTFIILLFSQLLFISFSNDISIFSNSKYLLFSIACWCLFNIFEFGRKTFATEEEIQGVSTYSKVWGRVGSVLLVVLMTYLILSTGIFNILYISILLWIIGLIYVIIDNKTIANVYRFVCSLYLFLALLSVIIY